MENQTAARYWIDGINWGSDNSCLLIGSCSWKPSLISWLCKMDWTFYYPFISWFALNVSQSHKRPGIESSVNPEEGCWLEMHASILFVGFLSGILLTYFSFLPLLLPITYQVADSVTYELCLTTHRNEYIDADRNCSLVLCDCRHVLFYTVTLGALFALDGKQWKFA